MTDAEARELVGRLEALLEELEGDPLAGPRATEAVGTVVELYGEGLARIVAQVAGRDDGSLARALAGDEVVAHLLALHDLHPVPLAERVAGALAEVRPYLESHGGDVELLGIEGGVARLRLEGTCSGCPSSSMTLKLAIEDAILKSAPEIEAVEAEGAQPAAGSGPPAQAAGLVALEVMPPAAEGTGAPSWSVAGARAELGGGALSVREVGGEPVGFLELDGSLYAYRPACPACGRSLAEASLGGSELACPGCGERYDVRRAGRSANGAGLQLQPVPLLEDEGRVKVALGAA